MKVVVSDTPEEAGERAARHIVALLADTSRPVFGVATGASPMPLYAALRSSVAGGLDLSDTRVFALDEYVGLDPAHPQSYHAFVERELTVPLGLTPESVAVPDGFRPADELDSAAASYDAAIAAAGGVDVQVVGIGLNGHLGFNEPGSPRDSRTRVVELAPETKTANAKYFGGVEFVPSQAISQGIGTVLDARHIVLVANGLAKAVPVRAALLGPQTIGFPASLLQTHPSVTAFLDREAASQLA